MTDLGSIDPRGDLSGVNPIERDLLVHEIQDIIVTADLALAWKLKTFVRAYLAPNPELWIAVNDELCSKKIISKARLKEFLSLVLEVGNDL